LPGRTALDEFLQSSNQWKFEVKHIHLYFNYSNPRFGNGSMLQSKSNYALVTGGSRGIGKEVCRQLLQKGKPVLFTSTNEAAGQRAAHELSSIGSAPVRCLLLDQGNPSSVQQLVQVQQVQQVQQQYDQQIDLLINNAAIMIRHAWDAESYATTLAVNTVGPPTLTEGLLPSLAPNSLIIMVTSGAVRDDQHL
jgi:NAD(P)-dependent dehydrogenase (short-subunit alcohol dehydrogenase family)